MTLDQSDPKRQSASLLCADLRRRLGTDDPSTNTTQLLGRAALLRSNAASTNMSADVMEQRAQVQRQQPSTRKSLSNGWWSSY